MKNLAINYGSGKAESIDKIDEPFHDVPDNPTKQDIARLLEPVSSEQRQRRFYVLDAKTGDIYGTEEDYRKRIMEIIEKHFGKEEAQKPDNVFELDFPFKEAVGF